MSPAEQEYCKGAVKNFNRLSGTLLEGDQYRLVSPYDGNHSAMMFVNEAADKAVLFAFDIHPRYAENMQPVRLQGLNPDAQYEIKEINLVPGTKSALSCNEKTFSGEFLIKVGIPVFSGRQLASRVIEISKVK